MDVEEIESWYDEQKEKYTIQAHQQLKKIEAKYAYIASLPKGKKKEKAIQSKINKEQKLNKKFAKKLDKLNQAFERKTQNKLNWNLRVYFFKHKLRMFFAKLLAPLKDWWDMHHVKKK